MSNVSIIFLEQMIEMNSISDKDNSISPVALLWQEIKLQVIEAKISYVVQKERGGTFVSLNVIMPHPDRSSLYLQAKKPEGL